MKFRAIFTNATLVIVVSLVAFFVAEFAVRVLAHDVLPFAKPSFHFGHISRPNFETTIESVESGETIDISINSQGFRDKEWTINDEAYRVLVVGDSFVEGNQVQAEERFTALLENELKTNGLNAQVFTLGKSGSGPETHLLYLKAFVPYINPDMIIHVFFNGNDFENVHRDITPASGRVNYVVRNGEVIRYSQIATAKERLKWNARVVLGQSYIAQLAQRAKSRMAYKETAKSVAPPAPFYCRNNNKMLDEAVQITEEIYRQMKMVSEAPMLILQVPAKEQFTNQKLYDKEQCNMKLPELKLELVASRTSLDLVQLHTEFGTSGDRYYWNHLNYEGHKKVAQILSKKLTQHLEE